VITNRVRVRPSRLIGAMKGEAPARHCRWRGCDLGVNREEGEVAMTTELTGWASADENTVVGSEMPAETLRNKDLRSENAARREWV